MKTGQSFTFTFSKEGKFTVKDALSKLSATVDVNAGAVTAPNVGAALSVTVQTSALQTVFNGSVTLQLQKRSALGQWVTIKRARLNASFAAVLRVGLPHGTSRLRVAFSVNQAGAGYLGGFSRVVAVRRWPGRHAVRRARRSPRCGSADAVYPRTAVLRALLLSGVLLLVAAQASHAQAPPYRATIAPLSAAQRAALAGGFWRARCPVALSELRVLTVSHWGLDGERRLGQLVVNRDVAAPLRDVFRVLYRERFPIRHMRFSNAYGPKASRPPRDVTSSFECREAVPSPCSGGTGTGTWSQHAYGRAIDLNPIENPYVGTTCGAVHDPHSRPFVDRSRPRPGMVTPAVVSAFRSIGWGWGGDWSSTKDYMHFSSNGH